MTGAPLYALKPGPSPLKGHPAKPQTRGQRTMTMEEGASFDPRRRRLCPDGACVGVLDEQGRCSDCGKTRHPPAPICDACRSPNADWRELSGRGEVYTYTIVHRPIAAGMPLPFVVAVVALEGSGGLRMITNLVDVDAADVAIGMAVEVAWEDMSEEMAIPRFRPARVEQR